jgi:hypothetical protein
VRIRNLVSGLIGLAMVAAFAAPAAAQGATRDMGGAMVRAGVSFLRVSGETGTGFLVDFGKPISTMGTGTVDIVGEFGFHNFGDFDTSFLELGGGPRFTFTPEGAKVKVIVQVVVGLFRVSSGGESANGFYFAPGGGVMFELTPAVSAFGQIDFIVGRIQGESDNSQRFTFGVAFNVGG